MKAVKTHHPKDGSIALLSDEQSSQDNPTLWQSGVVSSQPRRVQAHGIVILLSNQIEMEVA